MPLESLLPLGWQTVPPDASDIPAGCCAVICDASHKDGIAGISVSIRTKEREYEPVEFFAKTKGPVHAELKAIEKALGRLGKLAPSRSMRLLIVYTDCKYACQFLEGNWTPARGYIRDAVDAIEQHLYELDGGDMKFMLCHTRTRHIRRCDRRAKKKREEELSRRRDRIVSRIEEVETAIVRSRSIVIHESSGNYYARPFENGFPPGYEVSLEQPSCSCPWWNHHWGNKGDVVVNARALPCKHMCALAGHLGLDIYEIFSHQIERLD